MQSVDGAFRQRLKRSRRCTEQPTLSPKELELIHLLARGHNGPQIAALRRKRCDSIRHELSVEILQNRCVSRVNQVDVRVNLMAGGLVLQMQPRLCLAAGQVTS